MNEQAAAVAIGGGHMTIEACDDPADNRESQTGAVVVMIATGNSNVGLENALQLFVRHTGPAVCDFNYDVFT